MKDCPVCGKAGLADDVRACTQCNADLECFDLLDFLHEEVVEPERSEPGLAWTKELEDIRVSVNGNREILGKLQKSGWMRTYAMVALFALVLAALLFFVYRDLASGRRFDDRISQLAPRATRADAGLKAQELSGLIAEMQAITQRLGAMENGLSALSANQEATGGRVAVTLAHLNGIFERLVSLDERLSDPPAEPSSTASETGVPAGLERDDTFIYHEPHEGETLWSIAKRHYDNGIFFPVLLELNPGLGIYFDRGYGTMRILKDRQRAREILADVTAARGDRGFFRYKVVEGDTWERISKRFFGQSGEAAELATLNSPGGLLPGERVLIPLR